MKVCIVLGTRPELIKFTPIIEALQRKSEIDLCVINTGQHTDLLDAIPHAAFKESLWWGTSGVSSRLSQTTAYILRRLDALLSLHKPNLVLVQGDTTSALTGALAAANLQIPVGHVEAGLRTYDKASPFPEENNRRLISVIATYHFCISETSLNNLMSEHVGGTKILTGSTAIDMIKRVTQGPYDDSPRKTIVLTLHRRENIESNYLALYVNAIIRFLELHPDVTCLWVTHPNPEVQKVANTTSHKNLMVTAALSHADFIQHCYRAWAVCSDSGGIQEEIAVIQKPLFILRNTTERPEVLDEPNVSLVEYPNTLLGFLHDLYINPDKYVSTGENTMFGRGDAGERIADFIGGIP